MTNGTSTEEITDTAETVEEPSPLSRAEVGPAPSGSWIDDFSPWLEPRGVDTRSSERTRSPEYPPRNARDVRAIVEQIKAQQQGQGRPSVIGIGRGHNRFSIRDGRPRR